MWQGPDHLLWVTSGMIHEQYKRFFYKDVQAIILRKTGRQHIWTTVWSLLALLYGALALVDGTAGIVGGVIASLCVLSLLLNLYFGPGCAVYLQTAVQLERLPNLVRIPTACKAIDRIKTLAEGAQGKFSFQSASASDRNDPYSQGGVPGAGSGPEFLPPGPEPDDSPYRPVLHGWLFGLMSSAGAVRVAQLWLKSSVLSVVDMTGMAAALVLTIIVLVRWHRQVKGTLIAFTTWATLVVSVLHAFACYAIFISGSVLRPDQAYNEWEMLKLFWRNLLADHAVITATLTGFAVATLSLGVLGIIAMLFRGGGRSKPAAAKKSQ
ncbi:MAG: hypothetical protein KJP07_13930 [Desulfatitalea sp.]|nr:hypothetical protein [Desulfatitalea sp.]